jgi:N-acyl-L-homoserine lactone synthetase
MLYLIDPSNYACHRQDLDNMYRLRDKVFLQKLNWDVKSQNGMEKDEYDEKDAYYIIYKDEQGVIRGCQRFIEMTNQCMFDGPFRFLLSNISDFKRPGYWEVSRFAVDYEYSENYTQEDARKVFRSLLATEMHFGLEVAKVEAFLCITSPTFGKLVALNGLVMAPLKSCSINNDPIVVSAYSPLRFSYEKLLKSIGHDADDPILYYTGPMYAADTAFGSMEVRYNRTGSY